ncbi:hypothetical protein, partial [Proteiniborus sp.]|uniref:ATP-binding protein n=1 Tax=Proteiniborus sp. TaxID=2079015 RepID=UPI003320C818
QHEIKTLGEDKDILNEKQNKTLFRQKKIKSLIDQYSYFEGIESEEIEQLVVYFNIMEQKKQDLEQIYNKLASKTGDKVDFNYQNINERLYRYEELEDEKNKLLYDNQNNSIIFLNTRMDEKQRSIKKMSLIKVLSAFGTLLCLILGFIVSKSMYFISALPLVFLIYSFFSSRELKKYINELKVQISDIDEKERQRKIRIDEIEKDMIDILASYNCSSKAELRKLANDIAQKNYAANEVMELKNKKNGLIEEIQMLEDNIRRYLILIKEDLVSMENIRKLKGEYSKYLGQRKQAIEIEIEINGLTKEINDVELKQKDIKNNIKNLFEKNEVNSIDAFKEGLERKKNYERSLQLLESKKSLLNNILGENNIDFLKKKSQDFAETIGQDIKALDKEELIANLKEINDIILETKNELTRFEEKVRILSSSTVELVQIEEELIRKNSIKDEFEKALSSLELAKKTIDKISRNIQRDFAPRLNNEVGKIINKVTVGKYSEVKITESLDIKVVEPSNNKIVDVEKLSGGTIDQLYFAMRFGIIDIIKEENNLPLILDDCFVQYDYDRLVNILEFLSKESLNRQIILFTCHNREKEILRNKGIEYNLVNI